MSVSTGHVTAPSCQWSVARRRSVTTLTHYDWWRLTRRWLCLWQRSTSRRRHSSRPHRPHTAADSHTIDLTAHCITPTYILLVLLCLYLFITVLLIFYLLLGHVKRRFFCLSMLMSHGHISKMKLDRPIVTTECSPDAALLERYSGFRYEIRWYITTASCSSFTWDDNCFSWADHRLTAVPRSDRRLIAAARRLEPVVHSRRHWRHPQNQSWTVVQCNVLGVWPSLRRPHYQRTQSNFPSVRPSVSCRPLTSSDVQTFRRDYLSLENWQAIFRSVGQKCENKRVFWWKMHQFT